MAEIETALRFDPSAFVLKAIKGRLYYLAGDLDRSIAACRQTIDFEERFYLGYLFLGHALRQKGDLTEAYLAFHTASQLGYNHPTLMAELGHSCALMGKTKRASQYLERLKDASSDIYVSPHLFAHIHIGLGDTKKALHYLNGTYKERGAYLIFLATDPVYDSLRKNDQFKRLVQRVNFVPND